MSSISLLLLFRCFSQVDHHAQEVDGHGLRVTKVHGFVEELEDEGDVVLDVALIELVTQIGFEDADELEEVFEDESYVGVQSGDGDEV